ncbi:uncharacterized protein PSANT_01384 [Moesziomyces antarcticus]|uniref:Secreted protein n=1 Tax=Pseudozyma antarctica TaxID=84753 RepID=A0A5C3FJT3_PSEA2|nr:uncharacterized protein PSANT_01384 [Moesziomyces antarcticus]
MQSSWWWCWCICPRACVFGAPTSVSAQHHSSARHAKHARKVPPALVPIRAHTEALPSASSSVHPLGNQAGTRPPPRGRRRNLLQGKPSSVGLHGGSSPK